MASNKAQNKKENALQPAAELFDPPPRWAFNRDDIPHDLNISDYVLGSILVLSRIGELTSSHLNQLKSVFTKLGKLRSDRVSAGRAFTDLEGAAVHVTRDFMNFYLTGSGAAHVAMLSRQNTSTLMRSSSWNELLQSIRSGVAINGESERYRLRRVKDNRSA